MIQDPEMYPSYETDVVYFFDRLASLPAAAYDFDACGSYVLEKKPFFGLKTR